VAEAARERDALVHIHVAETTRRTPRSAPSTARYPDARAARRTRRPVLAAHAVHLDAEDIAVLARHGVAVAHCPGSNAKLAAGTAPVAALRKAAVPIALGTDGPASSDDLDLCRTPGWPAGWRGWPAATPPS